MPGTYPAGRDAHLDTPLTNVAIKAFEGAGDYIGTQLFPAVPVDKQSNKYYVIDKDAWIRVPYTLRAPRTSPRRITWQVSSDAYYAPNYALAGENAKEDLANADAALALRENTVANVSEALARDQEVRIASIVLSISNVGSGVTVANKWSASAVGSSNPIGDVMSGAAFIRSKTGLLPNTLAMDYDTYKQLLLNQNIIQFFKMQQGPIGTDALRAVFDVERVLVARGIKNMALEGATASIVNIWGNFALLARIEEGQSLQTRTFGLSFRWTPDGIPAPFQVFRYDDPDPGKKTEVVEVGYYQAEKVVARELAYTMLGTI